MPGKAQWSKQGKSCRQRRNQSLFIPWQWGAHNHAEVQHLPFPARGWNHPCLRCSELLKMDSVEASAFPRMKKTENLSSCLCKASLKVTFKKFPLGLLHLHSTTRPVPGLLCVHPPRCSCKCKAGIPQALGVCQPCHQEQQLSLCSCWEQQ